MTVREVLDESLTDKSVTWPGTVEASLIATYHPSIECLNCEWSVID